MDKFLGGFQFYPMRVEVTEEFSECEAGSHCLALLPRAGKRLIQVLKVNLITSLHS